MKDNVYIYSVETLPIKEVHSHSKGYQAATKQATAFNQTSDKYSSKPHL